MSGVIGLGLGFTSIDFEKPSSTIESDSRPDGFLPQPTHPAYQVKVPERSHRGPRSLGVGKRFVSSPSQTLPPSIYDKSTSNPLSIPSPSSSDSTGLDPKNKNMLINSPQLGLDLVNINPTQHLRLMKKRSFAANNKRDFGLSSNDPLNRKSNPAQAIGTTSSPTIGSSPTLGSSPIMSSSPIPSQEHHVDMLGPSIALSVVLGLLVLGVASWVGIHYRRKRLLLQQQEEEGNGYGRNRERDSDEKSFTSEMFNASNVVEKGLKPRSLGGTMNEEELRSSFISYKRPLSTVHPSAGGRRVSFVDTVDNHHDDQDDYEYSGNRNRRESVLPPPRFMIAALHRPEVEHIEDELEEELEQPVPSPRTSIAPTLEMIEEELEEEESTSNSSQPQGQATDEVSRDSIVSSTSSSSDSSTCSGDYTTASARSSISSSSALSIISSSFPQTPRDQSTPSPAMQMESPNLENEMGGGIYDSPTPTGKFQSRRKRAQSHGDTGLVEVQKHDLLRTAVGRTMSLQPTKEVREFIKLMTAQNEVGSMHRAPTGKNHNTISRKTTLKTNVGRESRDRSEDEPMEPEKQKIDEMEDLRVAAFISSQLEEKVTREQQQEDQKGSKMMARSTSFPSKLISRRKSTKSSPSSSSRKSEIVSSDGYLRKAWQAFNAHEEVPVIPTNIPISLARSQEDESIKSLAERQVQLERYLSLIQSEGQQHVQKVNDSDNDAEEVQEDPYIQHGEEGEEDMEIEEDEDMEEVDSVWDPDAYAQDMEDEQGIAFEDYYIHFESDDVYSPEQEDQMASRTNRISYATGVPHIRVTSH
ncbi:hypothetical protein L486_03943 [Kwoniella mangroviensis CBS 10435]|uniref:Uncharacterized protein n=1 Tax=Kwoniella mangroviensis CBS 10435 TaxID=1331196 RepID=A0A1B9IR60_9TREE|nr:hypothetical protein L486_03943 [Kwoniella mangroviensis CBS 10435]